MGTELPDPDFPLTGWQHNRIRTPFVEILDDKQLTELNNMLHWHSFSADSLGRRFGKPHAYGKRDRPQVIPDKRVLLLDEVLPLGSRSVLELGCFEGHHTVALCQRAKAVTAIDARVENVVKTIVRTAFFDTRPRCFVCNIEVPRPEVSRLLEADVCFHVGVLYHLNDPVEHLWELGSTIKEGILLDTHYATDKMANRTYETNGRSFAYHEQPERGYEDVFSGMCEASKWLRLDDIIECLKEVGFVQIHRIDKKHERNGPRVLILASR